MDTKSWEVCISLQATCPAKGIRRYRSELHRPHRARGDAWRPPADRQSRGASGCRSRLSEQLDAVEAARAEAEALRKATLALSQNLAMDSVLDTLLHCISDLVPFDRATVLFVENGFELMVARESPRITPKRIGLTLNASENVFLQTVLFEKRAVHLSDVARETEW